MGVSVDGASQSAFPRFVVHRTFSMTHIIRVNSAMLLYKQVGLFLIWMQWKNRLHGFAGRSTDEEAANRASRQGAKAQIVCT
jgi:hypothetical protein